LPDDDVKNDGGGQAAMFERQRLSLATQPCRRNVFTLPPLAVVDSEPESLSLIISYFLDT
jgi:hypothetical protein